MNSCLYRCEVRHRRLFPKEHGFRYTIFMFYLDLDEIDGLSKHLLLFSRNRFNWFNFRDKDHLQFPFSEGRNTKTVRQNVIDYLLSQGVEVNGKVMLMTNVSMVGYAFNPISFYLCFDKEGYPVCSVAEVCNTHGEMKLYLLRETDFSAGEFKRRMLKNFYVSPFSALDASFEFVFKIPGETAHMRVDDYQDNRRFLLSSLTGVKKSLTDARLFLYAMRFPFLTLGIMISIHWQAFLLRMKRLPYLNKDHRLDLQTETYRYKKA